MYLLGATVTLVSDSVVMNGNRVHTLGSDDDPMDDDMYMSFSTSQDIFSASSTRQSQNQNFKLSADATAANPSESVD